MAKGKWSALAPEINKAAGEGDLQAITALLDAGVEVDACDKVSGFRPLIAAAYNDQVEAVSLLIARGADIEARVSAKTYVKHHLETALMVASCRGNLRCAAALLEAGADANAEHEDGLGFHSLTRAAEGGHAELVKCLLKHGARVTEKALSHAICYSHLDVVEELLKAGGEHLIKEDKTGVYLNCALGRLSREDISEAQISMLRRLMLLGLDVNARNPEGLDEDGLPYMRGTVLMEAVGRKNKEAVKMLIDAGADVRLENYNQVTALHFAAIGGNLALVKMLVEAGAFPYAKDVEKRTPIDWANRLEHEEIVQYLKSLPVTKNAPPAKPPAATQPVTPPRTKTQKPKESGSGKMKASQLIRFVQEWGEPEWIVYAVEGPLETVTPVYGSLVPNLKLTEKAEVKTANENDDEIADGAAVVQVKECGWTIIIESLCMSLNAEDMQAGRSRAKQLSQILNTKAVVFMGEGTSGAMAAELYDNGNLVEEEGWDDQSNEADGYFQQLGVDFPICYPRRAGESVWLAIVEPEIERITGVYLCMPLTEDA